MLATAENDVPLLRTLAVMRAADDIACARWGVLLTVYYFRFSRTIFGRCVISDADEALRRALHNFRYFNIVCYMGTHCAGKDSFAHQRNTVFGH